MYITIYFKNGSQLKLTSTDGEHLGNKFEAYLRNPGGNNRPAAIRYGNDGSDDRELIVDLDSVTAIDY